MEEETLKIAKYVKQLLTTSSGFTGKLEVNIKDGIVRDINETKRVKF